MYALISEGVTPRVTTTTHVDGSSLIVSDEIRASWDLHWVQEIPFVVRGYHACSSHTGCSMCGMVNTNSWHGIMSSKTIRRTLLTFNATPKCDDDLRLWQPMHTKLK